MCFIEDLGSYIIDSIRLLSTKISKSICSGRCQGDARRKFSKCCRLTNLPVGIGCGTDAIGKIKNL
jgi:hypothetical protein